jgi:hypothetical protein
MVGAHLQYDDVKALGRFTQLAHLSGNYRNPWRAEVGLVEHGAALKGHCRYGPLG